jgi:hypothetical protein
MKIKIISCLNCKNNPSGQSCELSIDESDFCARGPIRKKDGYSRKFKSFNYSLWKLKENEFEFEFDLNDEDFLF